MSVIVVYVHENATCIGATRTESSDSEVFIAACSGYTIWKCERPHRTGCGVRTAVKFQPNIVIVIVAISVYNHIGIIWLSSLSTSIRNASCHIDSSTCVKMNTKSQSILFHFG